MSVSLVVIRLETSNNFPQLLHIQFKARKSTIEGSKEDGSLEVHPKEWPLLVSDTLLAMHRGQRQPTQITVTTLTQEFIFQEMAAQEQQQQLSSHEAERELVGDEGIDLADEVGGGGGGEKDESATLSSLPRWCSKESTPAACSSKEGTPGPSDDASQASGCSARGGRPRDRIPFLSGNPTVDVTHGILHLYKQNSKTSLSAGEERSSMVCMLSVPSSVTIHDLLQFTAPCYGGVNHIRIIRDNSPSQYMVLIHFRSQGEADEFYSNFNDRPFNTLEPDIICRLVYVAQVETTTESRDGGLPIPGHTELPTCPVCLERMDESVDGLLTILCNHSFHGECLAKWGDNSCPVCRYCQTVQSAEDQVCSQCGARESLWICLICGHVGCGRYVGGHAHRHFTETNHLFSLQLGNNSVWDYVRDNYVHRLLQSEGDGKVVSYEREGDDVSCGGQRVATEERCEAKGSVEGEEKLTSLQLEYTHLLSSQLETQRQYFEERMAELAVTTSAQAEQSKVESERLASEISELKQQLTSLNKEKQHTDKKMAALNTKLNKIQDDLETEQELNRNLLQTKTECTAKMEKMKTELEEKDKMIGELEGQVRDLFIHLDATASVASNPELQGASVALPQQQQGRGRGSRRRR